ncbi:teichuronic acid biosynthesis protein TuaC [Litchfieldia alkalitelluris]|uniref:teichuronic acid biosynthesis protein TuaC n=1 Tax=Litchfieldia alkalitelluris TaxID=304268 RepID=UPI0009983A31|nr:glycosyltransferase family 4 protein [Litchfieldia alkalitelluris]
MNVLWITSVYPSADHPGSGVFHETQVQALLSQGVKVTVICPIPESPFFIRLFKKQYKKRDGEELSYVRKGVKVYRPRYLAIPGQLRWAQPDLRIAACISRTLEEYDLKPDLIHAHFAMPSGGAARLVAKEKEIPWLLTLHGSDVNIYPHYSKGAMRVFTEAVTEASAVLAVSARLKSKTTELTGIEGNVLPIGVNLAKFAKFTESKDELRRRLMLPTDKKLVVFVGRLTKAKGVNELVNAMEHVSEDIAFVFVGDGPEKEKLVKHKELNRRLFLTGQVENEQVRSYLVAGDVFALPSYTEGMPTVLIEAIALKIPVICTAVGGVPELFGPYANLLIAKKSVQSLVERIEDIVFGGVYTSKQQQYLYEHIQKNYDVNRNASLLAELYQEIINEGNDVSWRKWL